MMIDGVPHMQANAPDGPSADKFLPDAAARAAGADPNDVLYSRMPGGPSRRARPAHVGHPVPGRGPDGL
jgi:hypothetical protein